MGKPQLSAVLPREMASKRIPPLIALEGETRELLLAFADINGIRGEIAALLANKPDPPICQEELPTLLKDTRERMGLSVLAMSKRTGLSRSVLSAYEQGTFYHYKNARLPTLQRLAFGYGLALPLVVSAAMRKTGLLPAPGAVEKATRKRQRTPVQ
jgi:transcriptional regulator with XRE-family HTH domain